MISEYLLQTVDEVALLGGALGGIVLRDIACDERRSRQGDTAVRIVIKQAVVAAEQRGHTFAVHIDVLGVAVAVVVSGSPGVEGYITHFYVSFLRYKIIAWQFAKFLAVDVCLNLFKDMFSFTF